MIDPTDKQNQAIPIEQQKRGRGRPATGAAMTQAEKQKAYRERQKAKHEEIESEFDEIAKQYGDVLRRKFESLGGDVKSFGLFLDQLFAEK